MRNTTTYIVAGLGNPGKKYENTRHNMGYWAMDALFDLWHLKKYRNRFFSQCAVTKQNGAKIVLLKPTTFMNESGRAIKKAMAYYNVPPSRVVIIYDDIDLPVGTLRIRQHGGPGTHNGMRSIVRDIGQDFARIRIGIGKNKKDLIKYVLSPPSKEHRKLLLPIVESAAKAIDLMVQDGIEKAMQQYNKK